MRAVIKRLKRTLRSFDVTCVHLLQQYLEDLEFVLHLGGHLQERLHHHKTRATTFTSQGARASEGTGNGHEQKKVWNECANSSMAGQAAAVAAAALITSAWLASRVPNPRPFSDSFGSQVTKTKSNLLAKYCCHLAAILYTTFCHVVLLYLSTTIVYSISFSRRLGMNNNSVGLGMSQSKVRVSKLEASLWSHCCSQYCLRLDPDSTK